MGIHQADAELPWLSDYHFMAAYGVKYEVFLLTSFRICMSVLQFYSWRVLSRFWPGWVPILILVCGGCTSLPKNVDRPVSTAFLATSTPTTLFKLVARHRHTARAAEQSSGFMLLSGPQEAYSSRLAMVEAAQKTLDLQYHVIHADASSERLMRSIVAAARRGVRVRILLDDLHSTGRNALVMRIAFEPNVEMRMFNPIVGSRASSLGRLWSAVTDFSRVQQRMHNKLFLADSVIGVAGGRNLGDAYFGKSEAENFVDLDVLAAGPIVSEMAQSFDSYWNSPLAYPVQSLITRTELKRLRTAVLSDDDANLVQRTASPPQIASTTTTGQRTNDATREIVAYSDSEPHSVFAAAPVSGQLVTRRVWDAQPMDLSIAEFVWAPAEILADKPAKAAFDDTDSSSDARKRPIAASAADEIIVSSSGMSVERINSEARDETVVDGLLSLMDRAQHELLITSPYFVPSADMKHAFANALARGVRVRVLTNSLASNDVPIAHIGYARHREDLLDMGVELYELRGEQAGLRSTFGSSGAITGASRAMLHSKVMVMDNKLMAVGSMNLDPRSQLHNTEVALLVRSRELAVEAAKQIDAAMREYAWHLGWAGNGTLLWRAPEGSNLQDAHTDPDSSLSLRLLLKLLGPLAPDHLL